MSGPVESILQGRRARDSGDQQWRSLSTSFAAHLVILAALWLVPELLARPPEPLEIVEVTVVPPSILGIDEPAPPPPPTKAPPQPRERQPEPVKPEPEPDPETPVLVDKKKPPPPSPPPPSTLPPPRTPPPRSEPQKRVGSPFGDPLGASTSKATLGVEDPNFTYGYYLDRVVALISANWVRPVVGNDVEDSILSFRILRSGTVIELRVAQSSGLESFDEAALRAVESSSPLPPLPSGYKKPNLGITLIVK